jgi:uncharacterized ferredoxin-like protein
MLVSSKEMEIKAVLDVTAKICLAARTAPKAKGHDDLVVKVATGETVDMLAKEMKRLGETHEAPFFIRDSGNLEKTEAVVLLGTRLDRRNIPACNFCGFPGCAASKKAGASCAISLSDLGIALGSAVSVAANHRVDNRIMYTIGRAAVNLGILGEDVAVAYGIPLSVSGKSPYFDR